MSGQKFKPVPELADPQQKTASANFELLLQDNRQESAKNSLTKETPAQLLNG